MDYEKIYQAYMEYIDKCRNMIKNSLFVDVDVDNLSYGDNHLGISEIVKKHRLKMIDLKLEHTMRMIEQVIKINDILGLQFHLSLVVKIAVMYHDIGRMRQSTWSNTFNDTIYGVMNMPFRNHGEDGYDIFINNDFHVDKKYVPVIGEAILYHPNIHKNPKLSYRFSSKLEDIKIEDVMTGKYELNEAEWQVAALIAQLVADIDRTDILYQYLSSDFEMIRDYVTDSSMDTLDNISKKWGVSKEEIIAYNKIDESNYQPGKIRIPILNMSDSKLEVPAYMKEMFYNNSWPELDVLKKDENWNFITVLWWRLSHFLNQISFSSILINIEESHLLEQIQEKIPSRIRPLVDEAFEYAISQFVMKKIDDNKGNIYLRK